jgi:septin family protein
MVCKRQLQFNKVGKTVHAAPARLASCSPFAVIGPEKPCEQLKGVQQGKQ